MPTLLICSHPTPICNNPHILGKLGRGLVRIDPPYQFRGGGLSMAQVGTSV